MHLSNRSNLVIISLILLLTFCGMSNATFKISENFKNVIDRSVSNVVSSLEWIDFMERKFLMTEAVPKCSSAPNFPSIFNITRNYLVFCYDKGALEPWPTVYSKFSQMITDTINQQYPSLKLSANITEIDITQLGYFPSLKKVVDSGSCDVAVSSTHHSDSRAVSAHFQCAYGLSFPGILRTELDNSTFIVNSERDLNQDGLIIAVANTSTFDSYVTQNCPKAKIIRLDEYQNAWSLVLNGKIHVLLGDGSDLLFWISKNRKNCESCSVKLYGNHLRYGSFITNQVEVSLAKGNLSVSGGSFVLILMVIFFIIQ